MRTKRFERQLTVADLRKLIEALPEDAEVGTFVDNGYSFLAGAEYVACNRYLDLAFSRDPLEITGQATGDVTSPNQAMAELATRIRWLEEEEQRASIALLALVKPHIGTAEGCRRMLRLVPPGYVSFAIRRELAHHESPDVEIPSAQGQEGGR